MHLHFHTILPTYEQQEIPVTDEMESVFGATHMTGGSDPFYEKIGYGKGLHWSFWKKDV